LVAGIGRDRSQRPVYDIGGHPAGDHQMRHGSGAPGR
jgi:hypothetical protein